MKKLILLIPLFLIGCATVKKTNTETELKTDSSASVNIDATKFSSGFTLEPVNLEKPILIGGKEHFNTRVIYNNSKETIKYRDTTQTKAVLKQEVKEKEKDYTKVIESVTTKIFWLLIIMFVIVMVLNYFKRKATLL